MPKKITHNDTTLKVEDNKIIETVNVLKAGRLTPFWKIITDNIDFNIKDIESQLMDINEDLSKQEMDRLKDQRQFLIELKETPQNIINNLSPEEETSDKTKNIDPYDGSKY